MKKVWSAVAKDLWIVLLDIIAVNAAYYLALLIRFYVNSEFRPTVAYYLTDWMRFTPWYTIACILIFMAWRLYGGMWRYAGLHDMNRIITASLCTTAVHVVGTLLFIRRMPITYYLIGSVLQFMMITAIRFSYRVLLAEKKRLKGGDSVPALVVGTGKLGRKVIRHLEDNTPYRAVALIGPDAGRNMDGIPVLPVTSAKDVIAEKKIRAIFIADRELSKEDRQKITSAVTDQEVVDFTGELSNLTGVIPLSSLLTIAHGPITLVIDGEEQKFESGRKALASLKDAYDVAGISEARIELKKADNSWMREYQEQTGEEVSFF